MIAVTKQKNYKKTLIACYLGFVTQAIAAGGDLKTGLLAGTAFPIILVIALIILRGTKKRQNT